MKKYQIIYADPPWQYDDPKGNDPAMGGITYPTMPDQDIYDLPIGQLADENCMLFLWATMPKLQEALNTISAWGFRYITCGFVWVKRNPDGTGIYSGLGHWVNGNAELVLMGRKGNPQRITKDIKQIVFAPRSRHSAKPNEVRERIVKLMGDLPRVELFARPDNQPNFDGKTTLDGWDIWGNEVKSDIEI